MTEAEEVEKEKERQTGGKLTLAIDFSEAVKQLEVEQRPRRLARRRRRRSSGDRLQQVKVCRFIT